MQIIVNAIRIMRDGKSVCNQPRYPINTWSCWDRLQDNIDRTNNVQESFHNTLQVAAGKHKMGYNEFISLLLKEHNKKEHTIATHIADGIPPEKKCKKNILRNEAVKRLYDEEYEH